MKDWNLWNDVPQDLADNNDYCQSIYELSKHLKPMNGLEIGVRVCKSALATMMGSKNMKLTGIDFNPQFPVVEFMNKYTDKFIFIQEKSPEVLNKFKKEEFDWIYIDGNHAYTDVVMDFEAAWPLLKTGGVMLFDDYDDTLGYDTGVKRALLDKTLEVTGKKFKHITMSDFGLHPNPHKAAILIKD